MSKKLIFTAILLMVFTKKNQAQELQNQVEAINIFIKKHSDSQRNSYAKINATKGNIYFYNGIIHSQELTFPVDKINVNNIKTTKKSITFYPNESGLFVIKKFGTSTKNIKTAWLTIINMSKDDRAKLKKMFIKFISDYQDALKKQVSKTNLFRKIKKYYII